MSANFFKINRGINLDPQTQYGAGDPPGSDGDIYYNSVLGKFRKHEGGVWVDLDTGGSGGGGGGWTAGSASVLAGATSRIVTFTSPQADTSYIVFAQFENTTDGAPIFQQVEITSKTVNGFTASWNMPTDTANYKLMYVIPSKTFMFSEKAISSSQSSVSVTPFMSQVSLAQGLTMMLQNTVDVNPQFQPVMLTSSVSASELDAGTIIASGSTSVPAGYLYCNGQSVLRTDYPDLFAKIGTAYGAASATHFNVPDFRGQFLRGQNDGSGVDPNAGSRGALKPGGNTGDSIGSSQGDAFADHTHNFSLHNSTNGAAVDFGRPFALFDPNVYGGNGTWTSAGANSGAGSETRPKNVNVRYYIRHKAGAGTSSFIARWNVATDSGNYVLANMLQATGESVIAPAAQSVTVNLPVGYGTTNFSIIAMMQNKQDSSPLFQPIVITSKTSSAFTAKWNLPVDSANYVLSYYAISYTA